jgi:DNA modification methylase
VEDARATLVLGSCFDVAPHLPDDLSPLFILDPPYNMLSPSKSNRYKTQWPDKAWTVWQWQALLQDIWRILQCGGRLLVFGKKKFFRSVCNVINDESLGYDELVWVHGGKDNMWAKWQELSKSERIAVFYRKADRHHMHLPDRGNHSDMLFFPKDKTFESMKPPALMQYLIGRYSAPGDVVVDLGMHTGVCGYAALREGRRFVGVERVDSIFEKAVANVFGA